MNKYSALSSKEINELLCGAFEGTAIDGMTYPFSTDIKYALYLLSGTGFNFSLSEPAPGIFAVEVTNNSNLRGSASGSPLPRVICEAWLVATGDEEAG